ncbi:MAG TPA: hypothetical protein VHT96_08485 [Clostridia bacterium]|nr:hypothetical protein [Clostridia bacterium]
MLKRITSICVAFLIIMVSIPVGASGAADSELSAPQGLTVSLEGTNIIVEWQNPSDVVELAKSSYKNYIGQINYLIDWRANGGEWHYGSEIPSGKDILDCYGDISAQLCGLIYSGNGNEIISRSVVNKVITGIPYTIEISEWLKTNNLEFRIRYIYNYWDDNSGETLNQNSSFSASALIGTADPKADTSVAPAALDQGIPEVPSSIKAPIGLVSEYMTLGLRWQVPEDIKTLCDLQLYTVYAVIDWKLNNGKWNDGLKAMEDKRDMSLIKTDLHSGMDMDGYVHTYLDRAALGIPDKISLRVWLADKTYSFRVRYMLQYPGENGAKEILSPYSNTVALGGGTIAPKAPKITAPAGLNAKVTTEYGRKKISFSWVVSPGTLQVNKKFHVTTYLDYKVKGGKWLTEKGGMKAAESTTGDLRNNYYKLFEEGKTQGTISYRVFFASEYKPDTYAYSGFSNVITVDIGNGKIISTK